MSLTHWLERRLGLAAAVTLLREHPFVIAVTGSVGKSTTKEMIAAMLAARSSGSDVRVSEKNYNNELGLPLTIFNQRAPGRSPWRWLSLLLKAEAIAAGWFTTGIKTYVLEMGADKAGDLDHLTKIAPPDIAVITGVSPVDHRLVPVHAGNYSSIEALADEKATLARKVRSGGTVVLNADDQWVMNMRHGTAGHVVTYGEVEGADVRIVSADCMMEEVNGNKLPTGLEVRVESFNRLRVMTFAGVYGRSVAYAAAAAVAVAGALDAGLDAVLRIQKNFLPLPGRTRLIPGIKGTMLLDDTYNASPSSVLSSVQDLARMTLNPGQRRVVCLGEMRELGAESENMHRLVAQEIAGLGIDLFVPCGRLADAMRESAMSAGMRSEQIVAFDDTPEAGRFLQDWIKPGDVVLAKASQGRIHDKGVRLERVILELMAEPERAAELLVRQDPIWKRK